MTHTIEATTTGTITASRIGWGTPSMSGFSTVTITVSAGYVPHTVSSHTFHRRGARVVVTESSRFVGWLLLPRPSLEALTPAVKAELFLAVTQPGTPAPVVGRIFQVSTSGPLGEFLRSRRAIVRPCDVGLPAGLGLRRTPGLRREELATLAGVSFDYYTRLEQGRERRPGRAVLDSLAHALRLTADDRRHLKHLAALAADPPAVTAPAPVTAVRPSIDALLTRLSPSPAYVLNRVSDMIAANPEGLALLHGIDAWPPERRNTVRYIFTHPLARVLFVDWEATARASVAQLRTMNARCPTDRQLLDLVAEIQSADATFRHLWAGHAVGPRRHTRKAFNHPDLGVVAYDFETLHLPDDELRISVYTSIVHPPGGVTPDPVRD